MRCAAVVAATAARFRALDNEPVDCRCIGPKYFPGHSEGERYCRQVLHWVSLRGRDGAPSQMEIVLCRLEAELEENKWKVRSVKGSSIGEMLGVKAGDKLESIDGRVVDEKTVYKDGSFKVKAIRVRRGEAAVDLQMKKPQK
jgi:hypothetical protein